ncbi:MAG: LacI family DNA-binding transcriptional regulator [Candidatus Promineifilaceae bacterium]
MPTAVTIRDVAKYAGVGVGTVSRVLNDSELVRESTRHKVLEAIEELNYAPSAAARRLSSGKTMAVGVVVPFFTNPSVVRRLQGIVSILGISDYDLVLFDVQNSENRDYLLTNVVQRNAVDGLLIVSLRPSPEDMERFLAAELPAVMVDVDLPGFPSVIVNNVIGARQATEHLLDLGHRRIAYLSDYTDNPFNGSPVTDRYAGYRQALAAAGVPYRPDYYLESSITREAASRAASKLLRREDRPTAFFAYCDMQAIGIIQAARELGIGVPEDLAVVGYDGIDTAEYVQLTTIDQSLFESGVLGAELLLRIMADDTTEAEDILLPTELRVRGTTAPPR